MDLDEGDDDVCAAFRAPVSLVEHGDGLPDAGSGAEVDPQDSSCHAHKSARDQP